MKTFGIALLLFVGLTAHGEKGVFPWAPHEDDLPTLTTLFNELRTRELRQLVETGRTRLGNRTLDCHARPAGYCDQMKAWVCHRAREAVAAFEEDPSAVHLLRFGHGVTEGLLHASDTGGRRDLFLRELNEKIYARARSTFDSAVVDREAAGLRDALRGLTCTGTPREWELLRDWVTAYRNVQRQYFSPVENVLGVTKEDVNVADKEVRQRLTKACGNLRGLSLAFPTPYGEELHLAFELTAPSGKKGKVVATLEANPRPGGPSFHPVAVQPELSFEIPTEGLDPELGCHYGGNLYGVPPKKIRLNPVKVFSPDGLRSMYAFENPEQRKSPLYLYGEFGAEIPFYRVGGIGVMDGHPAEMPLQFSAPEGGAAREKGIAGRTH